MTPITHLVFKKENHNLEKWIFAFMSLFWFSIQTEKIMLHPEKMNEYMNFRISLDGFNQTMQPIKGHIYTLLLASQEKKWAV